MSDAHRKGNGVNRGQQGKAVNLHKLPFARQLDEWLATKLGHGSSLWLGETPACLRMLGFPALPLRMSAGVLRKIYTGKAGQRAGIHEKFLRRLPELIDEPEAVFDSHTVDGALVVLVAALAVDGSPTVVVSVEANLRDENAPANMITSAYAKGRGEWVAEQVAAGRLRYWGKTKGPDTLEVSRHTLNRVTKPGSQNPSSAKILLPQDLCNYRAQLRDGHFRDAESSASVCVNRRGKDTPPVAA